MSVEPPPDETFSVDQSDVQPRNYKALRRELSFVLGCDFEAAEDWIEQHGQENAEEKIRSYWL